jgi:hypothetical protein
LHGVVHLQVSQLVSRTTMGTMQQLWRQHAAGMDELGRAFAERMYDSHSKAVKVRDEHVCVCMGVWGSQYRIDCGGTGPPVVAWSLEARTRREDWGFGGVCGMSGPVAAPGCNSECTLLLAPVRRLDLRAVASSCLAS